MYKLYWAEDSGALAPQILLEECGAEYLLHSLDLDKGEEAAAKYLAINPRGQVPALQLDDGSILTESAAIVLHLADSHPQAGLLPPLGSSERARVYRWLFYAASNLYEGILRFYYSDRYTTQATQAALVRESARAFIDYAWELLENELGEGPYLLGHSYSAADPYLLMLANWHDDREALFARNPKLQRLYAAVRARPAVERIWHSHYPQS